MHWLQNEGDAEIDFFYLLSITAPHEADLEASKILEVNS